MLAAITNFHIQVLTSHQHTNQEAATDLRIRIAARRLARERSLKQTGNQRLDREFGNRIVAKSRRTREKDARQPQLTADLRLWPKCVRYLRFALVHPKANVLDRSVEHIQPDAPD